MTIINLYAKILSLSKYINLKGKISMIHYVIAGGIFMWGRLLASICGFAVVLEKLWLFLTKEKDYTNE